MAPGAAISEASAAYLVHLDYLVYCQMGEHEHDVKVATFERAKQYALDGFQTLIKRLTFMCEQLKAAEQFDDLDFGLWEPVIMERIDAANTEITLWDGEQIFDVAIVCGADKVGNDG